jgi:hypothetical protein
MDTMSTRISITRSAARLVIALVLAAGLVWPTAASGEDAATSSGTTVSAQAHPRG